MFINVDHLISCMEWARARNLSEFRYTRRGLKVTLRRAPAQAKAGFDYASDGTVPHATEPAPMAQADGEPAAGEKTVTAPLAGVCHLDPETGGAPYVAVGDTIKAGQTVCVIEAMKVMTSVAAPYGGVLEEVFVTSGAQVAAGAPLMRVR